MIETMLDIQQTPRKPQYPIASDVPLVLYDAGFDSARVPWVVDREAQRKCRIHFTDLLVSRYSLQTAVCHCVM